VNILILKSRRISQKYLYSIYILQHTSAYVSIIHKSRRISNKYPYCVGACAESSARNVFGMQYK
jgi:hypothetical protein